MQYRVHSFGETFKPLPDTKLSADPHSDTALDQAKKEFWPGISAPMRVLLTTDGSFTLLLEALLGEPIVAETIDMPAPRSDSRIRLLQAESNSKLLFRSAVLKSAESGKVAAYVESFTVLERMSEGIQALLSNGSSTPIGVMLRSEKLETFREFHGLGRASNAKIRTYLGPGLRPYRTYTIVSKGLPIMAISEYIGSLVG